LGRVSISTERGSEKVTERHIYLTSPLKKEGTRALPMIEFSRIARKLDFGDADTLMFTSKQAVSFANEIDPKWREYPSIAIGPATKKRIESLGGEVIYSPSSFYGKVLAEDIARFFASRKILYLRPAVVSFDSKAHLAAKGITLREQVIYETLCREYRRDEKPPENSIIVFTSPSTIHCFLKNFGWDESYTAVVIGKATLEHLPENADFAISEIPSIDSCIEAATKLNHTNSY
jgi:uroporphyrinogen-III synthase